MSVAENVEFGLRMKGTPKPERKRAVADMLRMVSLDGFADRRPAQLSGGQRQRVALARALVNHPAVLLLDEPLGALDLKLRKQMQTELTRLQRQVGITFVYVTHDQEEAMAMSDRIAVMDHGRLLQLGTPAEILDDPQSAFVMEFFGSANVFPTRVSTISDGVARTETGLGRAIGSLTPGTAAQLLVRPEKLRLAPSGEGLQGTILRIARMGFVTHYDVKLATGQDVLAYRLPGSAEPPLAEGKSVSVSWDGADARVFPAN
jgi:spermidine/putrescine transport system ATP-binding protein